MLSRRRFLTGTATAALALDARPDELTATPKGVSSEADDAMLSLGAREAVARIQKGEIDPSFVNTHRASLEEGPDLYKTFRDKEDGCIKVVLKP